MSSLKNKKIIISAGASGIGWATAKVCLDKGATVYICDIDEKYLAKTKKHKLNNKKLFIYKCCLLYTSPSPRDFVRSRMPSSA